MECHIKRRPHRMECLTEYPECSVTQEEGRTEWKVTHNGRSHRMKRSQSGKSQNGERNRMGGDTQWNVT